MCVATSCATYSLRCFFVSCCFHSFSLIVWMSRRAFRRYVSVGASRLRSPGRRCHRYVLTFAAMDFQHLRSSSSFVVLSFSLLFLRVCLSTHVNLSVCLPVFARLYVCLSSPHLSSTHSTRPLLIFCCRAIDFRHARGGLIVRVADAAARRHGGAHRRTVLLPPSF